MLQGVVRGVLTRRGRAGMTALGAAVTTLAVVGCGSQVGAADHGQPPKLHIGAGAAAAGEAVPAMAPAHGRLGIFGGYVVVGALPTSPTHAAVWRWPGGPVGAASRDRVTDLAGLLGLTGSPQRRPHGWLLASSAGELRVRDGDSLAWSYVRGQTECPPFEVDIDNATEGGVGCAQASAVAPGAPAPSAAPPTPSDAPARALLANLHVSGVEHADTDLGTLVVTVDPDVGSLPTQGIATTVRVDSHGISAALGHLGEPKPGADYPLRPAKDAFADLGSGPRPMIAQYCGPMPAPASGPGVAVSDEPAPSGLPAPQQCASPEPIRVIGAKLGLLATWDGGSDRSSGSNVLVPAWFYIVEDSPYPVPVVAVDPAFIAGGPTPAGPNAGDGASSGGSTGSGGASAPAPNSVAPAPPAPAQSGPTS